MTAMRIKLESVSIRDYDKALTFYTEVLGFQKKRDIPLGEGARWITVVSPDDPNGTELLLEPNSDYPAMKALKEALVKDGIPFTAFQVDDIQAEYARLKEKGVQFSMEPTNMGMTTIAILDDTCGNLIQIYQMMM
jgi:predicted enzyme related to lactoylglutathione lyase